MKKIFSKLIFALFVLVLFYEKGLASHLVGGEVYYEYLGGSTYRITLKIYKDCFVTGANVADFDNPLYLSVFNNGNLLNTLPITINSRVNIPLNVSDPCINIPPNVCVEQATYVTTQTLAPIVGGYDLTYQRCCRNASIINLQNSSTQGASNTTHIPGSETGVSGNNSPIFSNFPPIYMCANTPFTFNHSALDADGDVLVYSLCAPNIGGDQTDPFPVPANPPPYSKVTYNSGFSASFPLTSNPAIAINASTGQLTLTPTQLGQFVVGICVSEFRNGVLLSTTIRDFQFNVVSCNNVIASIPSQSVFCNGYQVNFSSAGSVNAGRFEWDFGVTSLTTDVSTLTNPTYLYPDSGVYTVRLIAISATGACRDTVFSAFKIYPLLNPDFAQPVGSCLKGNSYLYNAAGFYTPDATFSWKFGVDASTTSSTLENNSPIFYSSSGTKTISLKVSQYGCTKTVSKTMEIFPMPVAVIGNPVNNCTGLSIQLQNLSNGASNYFWDFGVTFSSSDISTSFQPNITYPDSSVYNVMLVAITDKGCSDTTFRPTEVYHLPNPDFTTPPQQCILNNNYAFVNSGTNVYSTSLFTWNFQDGFPATSTAQHPSNIKFTTSGTKKVTFTAIQKGCSAAVTKQVELVSMPIAGISDNTQYCHGLQIDFTNTSSNATSYEWDFGVTTLTTDVSNVIHPTYLYPDTAKYWVTLVAINNSICRDTVKKLFYVFPLLKAYFDHPEGDCIAGNSYSFLGKGVYGNSVTTEWNFTNAVPSMSTLHKPQNVVFQSSGYKPVTLTYRENGCVKTYTDTVHLFETPIAEFTSPTTTCSPFKIQFQNLSFAETKMVYLWDFGDQKVDTVQHPLHLYADSGYYDVSLTVRTDSGCVNTIKMKKDRHIYAEYTPLANFEVVPIDTINFRPVFQFIDKSKFATDCALYIGNELLSTECDVAHYQFSVDGEYNVKQVVTNSLGCTNEMLVLVESKPELLIYIPNSFTPNGDGMNESFRPQCSNETDFEMEIFNRFGTVIFSSKNSRKGWRGSLNDVDENFAPQGVYVYKIKIRDYQNKEYIYTGNVSLIR